MPTDDPLTASQALALRAVLTAPEFADLGDASASDLLNDSPLVDGVHQPTRFSQIPGLGDVEITVVVDADPDPEIRRPEHHVVVGQCFPQFVAQARALPALII